MPWTFKGEPWGVHNSRYPLADSGARKGAMIKLINRNLRQKGISMTRESIRNSRRYLRTSATDGLSGVPKLMIKTPVLDLAMIGVDKKERGRLSPFFYYNS